MPSEFSNDFYRWLYSSEIEHKDRLDAADGLLTGVLTVLSGVGIYYLRILPENSVGVSILAFRIFAGLYCVLFIAGVSCGIMSLMPRIRALTASPREIGEFIAKSEQFHQFYHNEAQIVSGRVDGDLQELLREQFIAASQVNRDLTVTKSNWQARAKYAITGAIVVVFLNAYPTYEAQRAYSETQRTELIELLAD